MGNRDKKGTLLRRKRGSWFVALAPFMIRQGMKLFRVSSVYFLLLFIDYSRGQFWNWLRYLADKKLFSNFSEIASWKLLLIAIRYNGISDIRIFYSSVYIFYYVNVFSLNFISLLAQVEEEKFIVLTASVEIKQEIFQRLEK